MKSLKSQSACALLKGWVVQSATTPATTFGSGSWYWSTGCSVCYNTRIKFLEHTSVLA